MVQGYPEEDNSCSGFGCSLNGSRNDGKSFADSGTKVRIGSSAFLSYRTSNPSGYPHEQWCSYQSEKFKLRRFEKFSGETGGLMLNITGLNRFFFVRDFHDMRCKYDKVLSIIHQQIHEGYFPFSGQPAIIDVVPGTHASGSFPAYLAFNKYVPDTPLYREMYRLSGESMHLSRMSLTNWLEKGSTYFCGLIAYLRNTFWTQLFAYLNDGSYSIDNSIAERFIHPLAGERKNSLFFGSDKMARVSAVYHTIISTCRMQGVSVLDYFKRFFSEIVKGRRDYEHLLSLTIGLEQ